MDVITIIVTATIASFGGHAAAFILAFKKREKFVNFLTRHTKADISRLNRLIEKWGTWAIFITQYIYGFRILSAAVLGLTTMGPKKYFPLQFLSCVIWAVLMTYIGYFFGHAFQIFIGDIKKYAFQIATGIIVIGFLLWIKRGLRRQKDN